MNRLLGSHDLPLFPCVLTAPRWLAVFSDLPVFPAPSNAPAGRVWAAGFEVDRAGEEVAEPDE
jgi:hypothetical protein